MNSRSFQLLLHLMLYASVSSSTVSQHGVSLLYSGKIDENIVHSHQVKMKWSKVRHHDGFDPSKEVIETEEEDMIKRPTLAYTLTQRLSNQVFVLMMSKLPSEPARRIVQWKHDGAFEELDPYCTSRKINAPRPIDYSSNSDIETEMIMSQQFKEHSCNVAFTSIEPYFGATFNFTLTIQNLPMNGLSSDEIVTRVTPDRRGWTRPISTTDASIQLHINMPDFSENDNRKVRMAGNSRHVTRSSIEVDENSAEEVMELFLQKLNVILGGTIPTSVEKVSAEDQKIQLEILPFRIVPEHEKEEKKDVDQMSGQEEYENQEPEISDYEMYSYGIIPDIAEACWKFKMTREECLNIQDKVMVSDDDESQHVPLDEVTKDDMEALDSMSTEMIEDDLTGGDTSMDWDLSVEELEELRRDMIALDNMVDGEDDDIGIDDDFMLSSIEIGSDGVQWQDGENWHEKVMESEDTIECEDCFI